MSSFSDAICGSLTSLPSSELDFLRFSYACLTPEIRIAIQKCSPIIPPSEYYINLCKKCNNFQGVMQCENCSCDLCVSCTYYCPSRHLRLCMTHFTPCPICRAACACKECRKYHSDCICEDCSDTFPIAYTCGCIGEEFTNNAQFFCLLCRTPMDSITKLKNREDTVLDDLMDLV
jgi:hypothetical protein